jgi:protein-S-isoprenylcysteine O-methyltransferase Ste14
MLLRQAAAILILPATVTLAIPFAIARRYRLSLEVPHSPLEISAVALGVVVGAAGLALFASCVFLFWTRGRGTLAPWDPPRQFVAAGPYRVVRNPMITGVILVLTAEALVFRSAELGQWAGLFALINAIYIPLFEEPMLEGRFGESYRRYVQVVPRFIPRFPPRRSGSRLE